MRTLRQIRRFIHLWHGRGRIEVRLRPRGHADELLGIVDGILQARVAAPPVDGKANKALCRLIAKRAEVAPSRIHIVRGERARHKLLVVEGVEEGELRQKLAD